VGAAGDPATVVVDVVGAGTRGRRAGWVVIGDLAWPHRIADVEYANAGEEVAAGKRRRLVDVVHAAVVAAIGKAGLAENIGYHLGAIGGIVRFEHQLRNDHWISFVGDIDDPRKRERDVAEIA